MATAERGTLVQQTAARARAAAAWLEAVDPVVLLASLCGLQVAIAFWFGFNTPHNGWIWYSGGDATEYWTAQWSLAHGFLPRSVLGYGLPVLYLWVPWIAGPSLLQGSAVIAPLQAVVLVSLGLVCFWGVADRLFGRLYAWAAAVLWVLAPFLMLRGFRSDYHARFEQYFLVPHWFGWTNMGDLASTVAVLACTWATLRAVDEHRLEDAVLGGLLGGLAIGIKPANGFFLVAVAVLFLATRRWRVAAAWSAALVPALLTLALWKVRGLGSLPIGSASGSVHEALGGAPVGAPVGFIHLGKYVGFNASHLHQQLIDLREVFWSIRLLEFLVIAGIAGAIRRAPAKGLFLAVWFVGFCILKVSNSPTAEIGSATTFRVAEPGLPAFILLAAAVAFWVPRPGRRPARAVAAPARFARPNLRVLVPVVAVLGVLPLALVGLVPTASAVRTVRDENTVTEAPISDSFHLRAVRRADGKVLVSWRKPPTGRSNTFFVVYASPIDPCVHPSGGSRECAFNLPVPTIATTQATSVLDAPGASARWYYVTLVADYRRDYQGGDMMLISRGVHLPPHG
jgi:hypothetical protein